MDASPVIEVKKLSIRFPGATGPAVEELSFTLHPGRTLAIVGESGSGKSLTALALMGLLPKEAQWSGSISLHQPGNSTTIESTAAADVWRKLRGKVVSMVFQEPMSALNPVMKVGCQLAEAIHINTNAGWRNAKRGAIEWLRKVQIPTPGKSYHKYPHQMSGGQKQRAMIAIAMSAHPALLIADEPTTALDVTVQAEVVALMQRLQHETGTALIFITHDLALAASIADDVLVMRNGKMLEYGLASAVLANPQHPYTRALLACRPGAVPKGQRLPVVADFMSDTGAVGAESGVECIQPSVKPDTSTSWQRNPVTENPLLKVRHLRVWFPVETNWLGTPLHFLRAVEDVSFDLNKGEILGLVGESGCGKSTISRALMGLQQVESGQMFFENKDLVHMTAADWRRMRREVQMIFQDPFSSLNPRLTIQEALTEPMHVHGIVSRKEAQKEAQRLMDLVHLPADALRRYPHQFSGGQRQRIGIARAISLRPKLIICDESVSALDVSVQAQILNLLKELQGVQKLSYLFISHDLNVVHYIADRVLVMKSGKIIERGTAENVLKHPQEAYTKKLVAAMPSF